MLVNKSTLEIISENEFRSRFNNVSFPDPLLAQHITSTDYMMIEVPPKPAAVYNEAIYLSLPKLEKGKWTVEWLSNKTPVNEFVIMDAFNKAIQEHLDNTAKMYRYDSILAAISYKDDPNPKFAKQGSDFFRWRSAVWTRAIQICDEELVNIRNVPKYLPISEDVLIDKLPKFVDTTGE